MKFDIGKFDNGQMLRVMRNTGVICRAKIISSKSKYNGEIFDVSWAGSWGVTLKVLPINREYTYNLNGVELTKETIDKFKELLVNKLDGAVDFFKRQLKVKDVIFYNGELFRVLFFIDGITPHVALSSIIQKDYWGVDLEDEFITINNLEQSILIDDPLLLITI